MPYIAEAPFDTKLTQYCTNLLSLFTALMSVHVMVYISLAFIAMAKAVMALVVMA